MSTFKLTLHNCPALPVITPDSEVIVVIKNGPDQVRLVGDVMHVRRDTAASGVPLVTADADYDPERRTPVRQTVLDPNRAGRAE